MPTLDWLKNEFRYGYESGDVLSIFPDKVRKNEEIAAGGSYKKVFKVGASAYLKPHYKILEIGCGKGTWTRALLKKIPKGELTAIDFQEASSWLRPEIYKHRLKVIQIFDNSFKELPDNYFDFFWSFGVLCHNNSENISIILKNSLSKMKTGGIAVHQYGAWEKLERFGWERGRVPINFKDKPDNEIWWPRNTIYNMKNISEQTGWNVICPDLNILQRDGIIILQKP